MRMLAIVFAIVAIESAAFAQAPSTPFLTDVAERYWVQENIAYGFVNASALKLDVWYPHAVTRPTPTLVYIHGGGWIFGTKEGSVLRFLPFLEKGWRVVNVEYRMASNALAPAAVEDTRCALRWVFRNAKQFNLDTSKIVLTGHSAGGHLSLITAMLPDKTLLDKNCPGDEKMNVAAIINWYGITDVNDIIQGKNTQDYAVQWMGGQKNAGDIARMVSPLTYVRSGLPPIITIHGTNDRTVPYSHAARLHEALDKAKVKNRLYTINGGMHGQFSVAENVNAYNEIWKFLKENKIVE